MNNATRPKSETIRMLFELDRDDDPQLYDDLIRFRKGTKRINRLRLLAHEATLDRLSSSAGVAVLQQGSVLPAVSATDDGRPDAVFDMPVAADVFDAPLEK
jgi:hypothetical protein